MDNLSTFAMTPSHLIIQILKKLDNSNLVRMRQTCSFMNSLVEENKFKLASRRTDKDCNMRISQLKQTINLRVLRFNDSEMPEFCGRGVPLSDPDDLYRSLSAICIQRIHVCLHDDIPWKGDRNTELLDLFAYLRPVCDPLEIATFSATDEVLQLIESVDCININLMLKAQRDYSEFREAFVCLQKSPVRGKIRIIISERWWENYPDEDLFDLAKEFRMIDFYSLQTTAPFWCFIRDLYKSPERCLLNRMGFNLGYRVNSEFFGEHVDDIPFKILYEGKVVDRNFINIFYEDNECGDFYPTHVRKLKAGNKTIFCVENEGEQQVFIIDRTVGIIDGVDYVTEDVKMLEIIVSKEFLEASDERQMKILQEDGAKYTFQRRTFHLHPRLFC